MIRTATISSFILTFLLIIGQSAFAQDPNVGFTNSITMAETTKNYGWDIVGRLTEADLLKRKGEWQQALLAIDKALAQQSDWIPGLVAQSEILTLIGRKAEAQAALNKALSIDALGTEILISYKLKDPTRFIALFPQEWITQQLQLPAVPQLEIPVNRSNDDLAAIDYFTIQYDQLALAPDSVAIYDLLRLQISDNLNDLPQELDPYFTEIQDRSLRAMIRGNIELLYRHPNNAIYYYTKAIEQRATPWPELRYNRGLTFLFMNRYSVGCHDLQISAEQGFQPALAPLKHLCNF